MSLFAPYAPATYAGTVAQAGTVGSAPYLTAPNWSMEYDSRDPWLIDARRQERWLDQPRETQLQQYYQPSESMHHNPWLAPWVFPDGFHCFYCRGQGNRGDIGLPHLPCRGCQSNQYYKPSKNAIPYCTECSGEGIWKDSFCLKCGGKGLGSFYLPYACPKFGCGVRARTNWEIELHFSTKHLPKARNPEHHVMVTQPFLVPVGHNWKYNAALDGPRGGY